ncbi:MAG TPA: hypothetical protein VIF84_11620 [Candidatus Limnocylindrales bacterium]|jgi:hypothetical protein
MSHPVLGLPPADPTAGRPEAAARLRDQRATVAALALKAAIEADGTLDDRYDTLTLRTLLRDYERHIEQVALALETGEARHVTEWAEWIVPIYRRRRIPARDQRTIVGALRPAAAAVLAPDDASAVNELIAAWFRRLRLYQRLPGDHKGNPVARFIFKGAGILDDSVI